MGNDLLILTGQELVSQNIDHDFHMFPYDWMGVHHFQSQTYNLYIYNIYISIDSWLIRRL